MYPPVIAACAVTAAAAWGHLCARLRLPGRDAGAGHTNVAAGV